MMTTDMYAGNAPLVRIVDDQPALRDGVADLLASVGLRSRGYASASAFLRDDDPRIPGCIVLDVRMPDLGGFELLARITNRDLDLPVVFVTGHGGVSMAVRAMKAGAVDFLTKPFDDQQLIDAVNEANRRDAATRGRRQLIADAKERLGLLSDGERAVLDLTLQGLRIKQIAAELAVSEITVKVRRGRLLQKLSVSTLPELVRLYDTAHPS